MFPLARLRFNDGRMRRGDRDADIILSRGVHLHLDDGE